jgi:hypothetical protein
VKSCEIALADTFTEENTVMMMFLCTNCAQSAMMSAFLLINLTDFTEALLLSALGAYLRILLLRG